MAFSCLFLSKQDSCLGSSWIAASSNCSTQAIQHHSTQGAHVGDQKGLCATSPTIRAPCVSRESSCSTGFLLVFWAPSHGLPRSQTTDLGSFWRLPKHLCPVQLGPDAPSLRPRLTSSRKETGQVLSDLKESRKENAALKEKARGALLGGKGSCQTTGVGLCGRVERVGCVERSVEVQGLGGENEALNGGSRFGRESEFGSF